MSTVVSFPIAGIGAITLNPIVINLFGLQIHWYGLIIVTGILLAFAYACYRGRKNEGFTSDDMLDYFIYTVLFGVVGARAYYVLTSLDQYDSFLEMIQIWNGGLAIYGGIIAGGLTVYIVSCVKKVKFLRAFDMIAPAVLIGQILGRWGNFFNGEAFGDIAKYEFFGKTIATPNAVNMPWVMKVNSYATGYTDVLAHPTFLYESLWNLVGFIIINAMYEKKKYHGQVFFMYIGWYGFGRMIIEGFRADSLYVGSIKISQLVGLVCFLVSAVVLTVCLIKTKGKKGVLALEKEAAKRTVKAELATAKTEAVKKDTSEKNVATEKSSNSENDQTEEGQNGKDN